MARPRTERGDFGSIGTKQTDGRWRAWARYRDEAGQMHMVERWAGTKTKAESAVRKALAERDERQRVHAGASLSPASTVADAWADYEREVLAHREPSTQRVYRSYWTKHIEPALGKLSVAEVSEADAERLVLRVARNSGAGAAKTTRTVLLGVLERARKHRAIKVNPVKGSDRPKGVKVERVRKSPRRDKDRALTSDERARLLALDGETADLIAFMLGTGTRLGEACAVRWDSLELDEGTVQIRATVAKDERGRYVLREGTKTPAGERVVSMPAWLVDRLRARKSWDGAEQRADHRTGRVARVAVDPVLVFPSPRGEGVRDLRATDREIRRLLDEQGLTWATSHTFRRTVATRLLSGGMDPVQTAAVLGHSKPSLTLDKYGKGDATVQGKTAEIL